MGHRRRTALVGWSLIVVGGTLLVYPSVGESLTAPYLVSVAPDSSRVTKGVPVQVEVTVTNLRPGPLRVASLAGGCSENGPAWFEVPFLSSRKETVSMDTSRMPLGKSFRTVAVICARGGEQFQVARNIAMDVVEEAK